MADIEYSTRTADWLRDAEPDVRARVMSNLEQAAPDHLLDALSGVPFDKLSVGDFGRSSTGDGMRACSSSAGSATAEPSPTGSPLAFYCGYPRSCGD